MLGVNCKSVTLAVKLVNPDSPQCCSSLVAITFAAVKPDTELQANRSIASLYIVVKCFTSYNKQLPQRPRRKS